LQTEMRYEYNSFKLCALYTKYA